MTDKIKTLKLPDIFNILNMEETENESTIVDLSDLENNIINMEETENESTIVDLSDLENNIINMEETENEMASVVTLIKLDNIQNMLMNKYSTIMNINTKNIHIYGCSHSKCFIRDKIQLGNFSIVNCFKSGASMSGITKDISKLLYGTIVKNNISTNKNDYHVFKLGQVDVEYVFLYKKYVKKTNINKNDFFFELINNFIKYVNKYINEGIHILICGSNLPNPYNWEQNPKNVLEMDELPDGVCYETMVNDILHFNSILEMLCKKYHIPYFDTTDVCSIKDFNDMNILRDEFIGKDHHYKGAEMNLIYTKQIKKDKCYGEHTHLTFLNELLSNI